MKYSLCQGALRYLVNDDKEGLAKHTGEIRKYHWIQYGEIVGTAYYCEKCVEEDRSNGYNWVLA